MKKVKKLLTIANFLLLISLGYFNFTSYLDPATVQAYKKYDIQTLSESDKSLHSPLSGKRILVAVAHFDNEHFLYFQDLLKSFRDLCECGAKVSLLVYVTLPFSPETLHLLNSRMNCRHPSGSLKMKVIVRDAKVAIYFVDAHRKYFYDHLDQYDLFVYTEDDLDLRSTHFISYLEETEKLKAIVGEKSFADYGIGFLRYERDETSLHYALF